MLARSTFTSMSLQSVLPRSEARLRCSSVPSAASTRLSASCSNRRGSPGVCITAAVLASGGFGERGIEATSGWTGRASYPYLRS
jgi:hypothetical protein